MIVQFRVIAIIYEFLRKVVGSRDLIYLNCEFSRQHSRAGNVFHYQTNISKPCRSMYILRHCYLFKSYNVTQPLQGSLSSNYLNY